MENPSLQIGDNNWAVKDGSILGYNIIQDNYLPQPITFTRASTATRVNESGLIEEVATGVPRIDYTTGSPALLLEPQRTNSLLQSNTFNTAWLNQLGGGTIIGGQINTLSASNDAWKLTKDAASNRSIRQSISLSSATYAYSAFLKSGTLANAAMRVDTSSGARFMMIDLSIGTISSTIGTIVSTSIEDYGNGWYRCTMVVTESITNVHVYVGEFSGTIAGDIYCQRTQLEAGSYPTSYIPTSGTAVTRVVDSASKTGISSLIGQTEGTILLEIPQFIAQPLGTFGAILSLYTSSSDRIGFICVNSTKISIYIIAGGVTYLNFAFTPSNGVNKMALGYANNDAVVVVNGNVLTTDTSIVVPPSSAIALNSYGFSTYSANTSINQVQLFTTRLSNAELETLTTI